MRSAVAQSVERSAVNRLVVGSNPTRGANSFDTRNLDRSSCRTASRNYVRSGSLSSPTRILAAPVPDHSFDMGHVPPRVWLMSKEPGVSPENCDPVDFRVDSLCGACSTGLVVASRREQTECVGPVRSRTFATYGTPVFRNHALLSGETPQQPPPLLPLRAVEVANVPEGVERGRGVAEDVSDGSQAF